VISFLTRDIVMPKFFGESIVKSHVICFHLGYHFLIFVINDCFFVFPEIVLIKH
jgi:hypothetical protein